jgi:hypothetical protein
LSTTAPAPGRFQAAARASAEAGRRQIFTEPNGGGKLET